MLSKQEYKYRTKLIQELHCNKEEQKYIDEYCCGLYKNAYNNPSFNTILALRVISGRIAKIGTTANDAVAAINKFTKAYYMKGE